MISERAPSPRQTGRPPGSRTLRASAVGTSAAELRLGELSYLRGLGRRVAQVRVERGVSVATLAAASGLSIANLFRIERGRAGRSSDPPDVFVSTLFRVARALGVTVPELLP